MTARERVRAAFEHHPPDRTPFFEKLIKSPIADLVLGRRSIAHNFPARMEALEAGDWESIIAAEAAEIADTVERLGMDLVRLGANLGPDFERPKRIGEFTWREGESIVRFIPGSPWVERRPRSGRGQSPAPTRGVGAPPPAPIPAPEQQERDLIARLEAEPVEPSAPHDDCFYVFRRAREIMAERGLDPAIFVSVYAMPVCTLPRFVFTWFHDRPDLVRRYYEMHSRGALNLIRKYARLGADIVGLGGDLAADGGPLISPAHYRQFILPHVREQAELCRALGMWCTIASDGDVWPLLDAMLVESGVDGFEEIDFAAGMDLRRLKQAYPKHTFIGNLDIRWLLTAATEDEVERATVDCLEAGRGDGGHVLMSSNCIHEGVRPANFVAIIRAYRRHFGLAHSPPPLAVERLDLPGYRIPR